MPAFRLEAETPEHSNFLEEVLVGMLLGDAWLEKQKVNARFRFEQSHIRTEFFFLMCLNILLFIAPILLN